MSQKNILLLGSGLMAETVVNYLLKRPENHIIIASNVIKDAQKLASGKRNCTATQVDVTDAKSLTPLVQKSDVVISYVPWTFHMYVAKVCLAQKTHLVTASYIKPEMEELDNQVKNAGLTFLNEVGVDPGIDHMATMKVVDECAQKGEKIIEYESFCGGLPSPEFCDNPLGYKFSWSPRGALLALMNDAQYLNNGKPLFVKADDLLYSAEPKNITMALSLEGYPNRDSCRYQSLYRMPDVQKLVRGTLRFYGFSMILNSMKELNFLDAKQNVPISGSWVDLIAHQTRDVTQINSTVQQLITKMELPQEIASLGAKILTKTFLNEHYKNIEQSEILQRGKLILEAYIKLGFFNTNNKVNPSLPFIDNLVKILENSCNLSEGETDMIVMQHKFKIQKANGQFYNKYSTLIVIGQKNSFSAMAITVGTPTAIATQLILDNVITRKGVLMPNTKDVYQPILVELEKLGLSCKESDDDNSAPRPKL